MTLRARLTLALFAVALIPTAVFTVFTLDQLGRSAERWFRPGVSRALESSLETTRTALVRVEAAALAQADALAPGIPDRALTAADRARLSSALRPASLDFLQIYRAEGGRWRLVEQLTPPGVLSPRRSDLGPEIERSLDSSRVIHSDQGALAAVAVLPGGRALVTGIWVPSDFFARVQDVGVGVSRYGQLGVLVRLQRQYVWLLVSLLVLLLAGLALALATWLARGMARPLHDMAAVFERVAGGDLSARVTPAGARELRTLGESFNLMTARLEAARSSLKEAEREAAWREVAQRLAHEFKNILTPMSLALYRLASRTEAVAPEQRRTVGEIVAALEGGVEQLARLADQFAQYARLPEPRFEVLDLGQVALAAAGLHEPEGVEVALEPGPALPVRGDSLLLSRAIHNLLLNACEASPRGGRVELCTFASGGEAVLEIRDRGPGLAPAVLERAFEPYVSTKKRSSGLGLALVRDIVTQHHGSVTLENREDGGARARLALPLLEEAAPRP